MHCIQGSDAHVLERLPTDRQGVMGIGDRATELLLPALTFEAIKELFLSDHFERHRPYRSATLLLEQLEAHRAEGQGPRLAFYEGPISTRTISQLVRDIAAMANGDGGSIYVGASPRHGRKIKGVDNAEGIRDQVASAVAEAIVPRPDVSYEVAEVDGKGILVIRVAPGNDPPYVISPSQVYVRTGSQTRLATREELVGLVAARAAPGDQQPSEVPFEVPRSGVEIVASQQRDGEWYHSMCDLRTGKVIDNVTRWSSRDLWKYAIMEHEQSGGLPHGFAWVGHLGARRSQIGPTARYDLAVKLEDGRTRVFYGVSRQAVPQSWMPALNALGTSSTPSEDETQSTPARQP